MAVSTIDIKCSGCGAPVDIGQKMCKYCKSPVTVSTFNSVFEMPDAMVRQYASAYEQSIGESPHPELTNTAIAKCYHKLKLYDKALQYYERSIEDNFDNSESYFYAAICLLKGKKAFLTLRPEIDKIEEYLNAAIAIEPKGIYYYLWAYIKYDYYSRKSFNTSPTHQELLQTANSNGISPFDVQQIYSILGVTRPDLM